MENINYKMGWLLVVFDLPVKEPEERKSYMAFHDFLIEDGYIMIQYSVYARPCVTYARQETHLRRIKEHCPAAGEVRALIVTNIQWDNMLVFHGPVLRDKPPEIIPEQMQFW